MEELKVLNLYASLGGNRFCWDDVANEFQIKIKVFAVEIDKNLGVLYKTRFPNDTVIMGDAHEYLLHNYSKFDFIWSSPPCPSHSKARFWRRKSTTALYPDMKLYQEILFLKYWFSGAYLVENVVPYYVPLIPAKKIGRHLFWSNFDIPESINFRKHAIMGGLRELDQWSEFHAFDFNLYRGEQRRDKVARNLVDYQLGADIFRQFLKTKNL
jgi:DNA (cytosine-5)-methyltransferase 1